MTLARGTTAPEESLTVPTILPVSFCAQHRLANSRNSEHTKRERDVNEDDMANLLADETG
jgi:hypothetical protein